MSDKYKDVTTKLCEIEDYIIELKNNVQSVIEYVQNQQLEIERSDDKENTNANGDTTDE